MGPPVASLDAKFYRKSGDCLLSTLLLLPPHALPYASAARRSTPLHSVAPPLLPMFPSPPQPLFPLPLFVDCCLLFNCYFTICPLRPTAAYDPTATTTIISAAAFC
jgi:hypothetical protein